MGTYEREYIDTWVSHSVVGIIATIAVALRFYARRKQRAALKWDDWFALLALLTMWGDFACAIWEYTPRLKYDPSVKNLNEILQLAFASEFFTTGCETCARLSVVFLYYRLFSIKRWLEWWLKIVAALSILWFVVVVFVISFQCKPVAAVVDSTIQGTCLSAQLQFIIGEGLSLGLDLILAILAVKVIWNLHLRRKSRVSIAILFLVGSLVIVTQIVRMVLGYKPNATGDQAAISLDSLTLWTGLHLSSAIICACVPVLRMFLPKDDSILYRGFRQVYESMSGWASHTWKAASEARTTEQSLPNYVNREACPKHMVPSSDEIPLNTNSAKSLELVSHPKD